MNVASAPDIPLATTDGIRGNAQGVSVLSRREDESCGREGIVVMPCTSWGVRVRLSCRVHAVADVRGVSGKALALAQSGDECNAMPSIWL